MNNSKWPDFLFTVFVRFVFGCVLGGLGCFLLRFVLRAFSHEHIGGPLTWFGIFGLVGGIIAVFNVPRWQTPWYKRDTEPGNLQADLALLNQAQTMPGASVVKTSISIRTEDENGQQHQYSSMAEVPPEIRSEIEQLAKEAAQQKGKQLSVTAIEQRGNGFTAGIVQQKKICLYKIIDESGVERTYHSLDEMPPELRAAVADSEKNRELS
jgi:hypothetical protein